MLAAAAVASTSLRDLELGELRAAAHLFDGVAIQVARREIHRGEIRRAVQRLVDETHALEELGPVDIRHEAHARDDVAHGHVRGALPQMLLLQQPLGAGALLRRVCDRATRSAGVTFGSWSRNRCTSCTAKAGANAAAFRSHAAQRVGVGLLSVHAEQAIGHRVGFLARGAAVDDALRDASQVLDEHDAQRDGHGPQLADGQRFDASDRRARIGAAFRVRNGCRCGRRMPTRCRTRAENPRTVPR